MAGYARGELKGKTRTSEYYERTDGIITQVVCSRDAQTMDDARANVAMFEQISAGKPRLLLVDMAVLVQYKARGTRVLRQRGGVSLRARRRHGDTLGDDQHHREFLPVAQSPGLPVSPVLRGRTGPGVAQGPGDGQALSSEGLRTLNAPWPSSAASIRSARSLRVASAPGMGHGSRFADRL